MLDTLKCPRCDHLPQFCECGEYHDPQPRRVATGLSAPLRTGYAATCATCGRTGREGIEVSTAWHWQGGKGHVLRTYCREIDGCFARRERQEATR